MIILSSSLALAAVLLQAASVPSSWTVTAISGPLGAEGQKITLTVGEDGLVFAGKKTPTLRISVDQIQQMVYAPARFSRAGQLLGEKRGDKPHSIFPAGCGDPGCGGAALVFLVALATASTMHGESHYVTLTWEDRGAEQQIQFEIGKAQRDAISDRLRRLVPHRWIDVVEQKQRVETLIAEHRQDATALSVSKLSLCGEYALPSGDYRMIVAGSDASPDVYLFSGDPAVAMLRAVVHAHASDAPPARPVDYVSDSNRIRSIQWHEKSLIIDSEDR